MKGSAFLWCRYVAFPSIVTSGQADFAGFPSLPETKAGKLDTPWRPTPLPPVVCHGGKKGRVFTEGFNYMG